MKNHNALYLESIMYYSLMTNHNELLFMDKHNALHLKDKYNALFHDGESESQCTLP